MGRPQVFTDDERHIRRIRFGMINRCYNKSFKGYKYYGGKGIEICEEWLNDADSFCEWATSNGYSEGLTIDRINGAGNYEPSNCRWITLKENIKRATSKAKHVSETERIIFCAKVAEQKKLRRLTNQDLAKMTGYSLSTIKAFMCGARDSDNIAKALARTLDIEL